MALLGIFRKKEKKAVSPESVQKPPLLLELCKGDDELYKVLSRTLLVNPRMTMRPGVDSYVERAEGLEKSGDSVGARIAYQAAGEISQFEGKLAQTQKFFKKAAEADPNYGYKKVFEYYAKKENAERALAVAHEYYTKTGKLTGEKESSAG